jgi:lysophospholipase L1-like esterase
MRLTVAGLSLLLALGGFELLLRSGSVRESFLESGIEAPKPAPAGEPDFRVPMASLEKPPHTFRIVAIGDSYTYGSGVYPEDAYPQRLATRLGHLRPASKIEVLPWARRGWNTAQELRSISPHVDELDPDLLLIGFVLNDAEPTELAARERLRKNILPRLPETTPGRWLRDRSALFGSLWESLENIRLRRQLAIYYRSLNGDGPGVAECRRALKSFRRIARQRDIPLLVVVFPVFDSQLDHRYRYGDSHTAIVERLEALGIRAIDLLPYYQGLDARRLAVTPFTNPHPNELAHRIAADVILRYLIEHRLIT